MGGRGRAQAEGAAGGGQHWAKPGRIFRRMNFSRKALAFGAEDVYICPHFPTTILMKRYAVALAAIIMTTALSAQEPMSGAAPAVQKSSISASSAAQAPTAAAQASVTAPQTQIPAETTSPQETSPTAAAAQQAPTSSAAPATSKIRIDSYFEGRADARFPKDGDYVHAHLANLYVNAAFGEKLSFHWRVRFSKWYNGQNVINSSDFLYLKWQPFEHLRFKAGRECLYIGGYEYEQAPIDIFYTSEFCNNVAPYKFTATVDIVGENDWVGFQVGETPFGKKGLMFSTMWNGHHGFFDSLWSLNAGENLAGEYSWLIGLGNQFHLTDDLTFFFDYTDRLHSGLLKDFTIVPKLTYRPTKWFRTRLEGSFDYNRSGKSNFRTTADASVQYFCSLPDEFQCINGGLQLEFFPSKALGDDLRIHCAYNHRQSKSFVTGDVVDTDHLNIGVTFKLRARLK